MKKTICIVFAVLFALSVVTVPAFATTVQSESETEIVTDLVIQTKDGAELIVPQAEIRKDDNAILIDKGESITLHYRKFPEGGNVAVPKDGFIYWAWTPLGGFVSASLSKDRTTLTLKGTKCGQVLTGAMVYDSKDNLLSDDFTNILIRYSGFEGFLDTISGGLYSHLVYSVMSLLDDLRLVKIHEM